MEELKMKPTKIKHTTDSTFLEGLCIFAKENVKKLYKTVEKKYGNDGLNILDMVNTFAETILKDLKNSKYIEIIIHYEND